MSDPDEAGDREPTPQEWGPGSSVGDRGQDQPIEDPDLAAGHIGRDRFDEPEDQTDIPRSQ